MNGDDEKEPEDSQSHSQHSSRRTALPAAFQKEETAIQLHEDQVPSASGQIDENIVDWDGEDDPANPINWSPKYKWSIIVLITMVEISVIIATLIAAPVAPQILIELNSNNELYRNLLVSIWELGEVISPLIAAALSELYGRYWIFHGANVVFIIFSIAAALSPNIQALIAFRFLGGASVACVTLNPSIIGDMFVTEQRGRAMSIVYFGIIIGPVVGPIVGSYLGQAAGWRWNFWFIAILTSASEVALLLFFRETYQVRILEQKAKRLRKETGNQNLRSKFDKGVTERTLSQICRESFVRPIVMLFTSPVLAIIALCVGVTYGAMYIVLVTISPVFQDLYDFSEGAVGLTYLGQAVGMILGVILSGALLDYWVAKKKASNQMTPEQRLPLMIVGCLVFPAGLFVFGWTVKAHSPWIAPIIGTSMLGLGFLLIITPTSTYLVDAFGIYSASAVAANLVFRNILGTVLPLSGPSLYENLGYGWGNSLFGFIMLAFVPVPFFLMAYGGRMRAWERRHEKATEVDSIAGTLSVV